MEDRRSICLVAIVVGKKKRTRPRFKETFLNYPRLSSEGLEVRIDGKSGNAKRRDATNPALSHFFSARRRVSKFSPSTRSHLSPLPARKLTLIVSSNVEAALQIGLSIRERLLLFPFPLAPSSRTYLFTRIASTAVDLFA